jgi:hypothetical protein
MVFPDHLPTTWIKQKLSNALQVTDCTDPFQRETYEGALSAIFRQRQPRFFWEATRSPESSASPDIHQ